MTKTEKYRITQLAHCDIHRGSDHAFIQQLYLRVKNQKSPGPLAPKDAAHLAFLFKKHEREVENLYVNGREPK